jgi:hypothetical protein
MTTPTSFKGLVQNLGEIFNLVIGFLVAFVFVYVVWKMFDAWVLHAGDESKLDEGKQTALVAVIALVVIVSVWGVVLLLQQSFFG